MSKGYGFVDFEDIESAKNGMALDGSNIMGRKIVLEFSAPRNIREDNIASNKKSNELNFGKAGHSL